MPRKRFGEIGYLVRVTLAVVTALVVVSCGGGGDEARHDLTQTHALSGEAGHEFPWTIDYPDGWTTAVRNDATFFGPTPDVLLEALRAEPISDVVVIFDHKRIDDFRSEGLPADATLDDLVDFNERQLEWEEIRERSETTIFGESAIRTRVVNETGESEISIQGFRGDEFFLLDLLAPDEAALEQFLPTFQAMVESIRAEESGS